MLLSSVENFWDIDTTAFFSLIFSFSCLNCSLCLSLCFASPRMRFPSCAPPLYSAIMCCVCVCKKESVCLEKRECVCLCVCIRERVCVCVREREACVVCERAFVLLKKRVPGLEIRCAVLKLSLRFLQSSMEFSVFRWRQADPTRPNFDPSYFFHCNFISLSSFSHTHSIYIIHI